LFAVLVVNRLPENVFLCASTIITAFISVLAMPSLADPPTCDSVLPGLPGFAAATRIGLTLVKNFLLEP
jgi:hypothetical protein